MAAHTSASYGHKMHITSGSNGRFHPLKPENMQPSFKSHIEKELNALAKGFRLGQAEEQETQTQKFSSCHLGGLMDGDKLFAHVYNNTSSFQCN